MVEKRPHVLPQLIIDHLSREKIDIDKKFIIASSPINLDGRFVENWFIIFEKVIIVSSLINGSSNLIQYNLSEYTKCSSVSQKGGGCIQLKNDKGVVDILRYSNSSAYLFSSISDRLNRYLTNQSYDLKNALKEIWDEEIGKYCSSCYRPYAEKTKTCQFCTNKKQILLRVLEFVRPFYFETFFIILLMGVGTLVQVMPPKITGMLVDDVLNGKDASLLAPLVSLLAVTMIASILISILHARLSVKVGGKITNAIRFKVYQHIQNLSLNFFDKQQTGALMSRISNDTQAMQGFLVEGVRYTIHNILIIVVIVGAMMMKNFVLGLMVLLPMPFVVFLSKIFWRKIAFYFRKYWESVSSLNSYLSDSLSGIREIKATGQEERVIKEFKVKNEHAKSKLIQAEQSWQTLVPILNFIVQTSLLLVWYFGGLKVLQNPDLSDSLTTGDLITFIGYLGLLYGPLQLLTRLNDWIAKAVTSAERIFEVLDTSPVITFENNAIAKDKLLGEVTFDNVSFGYEKHKPVIQSLSLVAKQGEMIGLVGKSGVGKSTIMKLLIRLYDVDDGRILIDGIDVKKYDKDTLNKNVSIVMQDSFLFSGSVAQNICFGYPEATKLEMIEVAMQANAHDFIMKLPFGYDTFVGERGARLSGGERQRISIARALLGDPKIIILDEATSSVDTETEQKIQEALGRLTKGRTTFAIAHRLSTLRNADKLFVLNDGCVLESGSHDELMEKKGEYYNLVSIQTEWAKNVFISK